MKDVSSISKPEETIARRYMGEYRRMNQEVNRNVRIKKIVRRRKHSPITSAQFFPKVSTS